MRLNKTLYEIELVVRSYTMSIAKWATFEVVRMTLSVRVSLVVVTL